MKRKTYNNVMKAIKMIQKKGYSFEEANKMAIRFFDEHTKDMNSIEFYIDKIMDKEEWEKEFCVNEQNNGFKWFMLEKVKYDIGTKVRTRIHFINDSRNKVEAVICGIVIDGESNKIEYKIHMEPTKFHKYMGSMGSTGYVDQEDILNLC